MNFVTVTVPTTLQAANQHTVLENRRHPQPLPRQELPWQHHQQKEEVEGIRSEAVIVLPVEHTTATTATSLQVTTTASTAATATPALRKQDGPKLRISVRRRVTDALNSPFNYEMTEAARVVL